MPSGQSNTGSLIRYNPMAGWIGGLISRRRSSGINVTGPLSVPGLVAWYDASDAATLFQDTGGVTPATANDDPVALWLDKSGNARNMSQGTDTKRVLLKTNVQNGLNVLQGDGTDDILVNTAYPGTLANHTIFVVTIRRGTVGTGSYWSYNTAATNNGWRYDTNGVGTFMLTFGAVAVYTATVGNWAIGVTNIVATTVADASAYNARVNATDATPQAIGTMAGVPTRASIFGLEGQANTYANIDIGEWFIYSTVLSPAIVIAMINNYLNPKWAAF